MINSYTIPAMKLNWFAFLRAFYRRSSSQTKPTVECFFNTMDNDSCKYGRLTVLEDLWKRKWITFVKCVCDCWVVKEYRLPSLKYWTTRSCGCYRWDLYKERMTTHWLSGTMEYKAWCKMKERCYQKSADSYKTHWARWVIVCKEWINSPEQFIKDMWPKPSELHTLDRIDWKLWYFKENCRWATQKQQQNNRINNHLINYKWEMKTISEVADILWVNYYAMWSRVQRNSKLLKELL